MKETYNSKFIKSGLLDGVLLLTETELVFRTKKLSENDRYKKLCIPYQSIKAIKKGSYFLAPTVTFILDNKKRYSFLMFKRKQFLNHIVLHLGF